MKKSCKFILVALFAMVMFTVLGCKKDQPYLELYNDTGYKICVIQGYVTGDKDWDATDITTNVWLSNTCSNKFYINTKKHYNDIVQLNFYVDWNGDGNAQFNASWHMGDVSGYPEEGYVYSKATMYGDTVATTWESHETRSVLSVNEILNNPEYSDLRNELEMVMVKE